MKSLSFIYKLSMVIALIGWLILFFFAKVEMTDTIITLVIVLLLCGIYGYLLIVQKTPKGEKYPRGNFKTFEGLVNFFRNPKVVLVGWIHLLAFDLMVGLYIKNDALMHGISFWWIIPSLLLTILFGPLGLLSYLLLRFILV